MPRPRLPRGVAVALLVLLAGCLGIGSDSGPKPDCDEEWTPRIEAASVTLAPGETTTFQLTATNISGISYFAGSDLVWWLEFTSIDPPPDRSADSYPPQYFWVDCVDVEVTVAVAVPADAAPGEYGYGVHVIQNRSGRGDAVDRRFSITVTER